MEYKKFNQELHDLCDPPAREAVTDWIEMKWGLQAKPNPDKYGVDLIVYRRGEICGYVEVETRDWGPKAPGFLTLRHDPYSAAKGKAFSESRHVDLCDHPRL